MFVYVKRSCSLLKGEVLQMKSSHLLIELNYPFSFLFFYLI